MTRVHRSDAGREVLSASERLLDGLLADERRCFTLVARGLADLAEVVEAGVRRGVRQTGKASMIPRLPEVLPGDTALFEAVMPPVGDLLAVTRERTLVVLRRQLKACESVIASRWEGTASRATAAAKAQSTELEVSWFDRCWSQLRDQAVLVRIDMANQVQMWWARGETVDELVARLVSEEQVRLPGSSPRGAWWGMRWRCNAEARNASVGLTNGLLLAGMAAWNRAVAD